MVFVLSLIGMSTSESLGSGQKVKDTLGIDRMLAMGETVVAKVAGEEKTAGETTAAGGEGQVEQQGQQESIIEMEETLDVRDWQRSGISAALPKARS